MSFQIPSQMDTSVDQKYHGLINHGATCYLNSVLQVLFMTKNFRESLQKLTSDSPDFIELHLKDLFLQLLQQTADTNKIIQILHIDRVNEQQDAAEYLLKILRASPIAADIFHGDITSSTICTECKEQTNRDGPFWCLPLPLIDSSSGYFSVVCGLDNFLRTSYLTGENQMYCEKCDCKVDAEKKNIVKHHPDVLILLLKRFDFNYLYMSYVKINSAVDVPYTLKVPENQNYELYAVVDHFGDLRSGHYSATIKDPDNKDRWYRFDDASVTEIQTPVLDNDNIVRSYSAYLLFYRKKDPEEILLTSEGDPNSTWKICNQSPNANPGRMTRGPERTKEVSSNSLNVEPENNTAHMKIACDSGENESWPAHNNETQHVEKQVEQVSQGGHDDDVEMGDQENRRTKAVTEEKMEEAGIKYTLKKTKFMGNSVQQRLMTYRVRKQRSMGILFCLSRKGRNRWKRYQKRIQRKLFMK